MRISELLALSIEKHISDDRQTLYIRQQRKKDGSGVTDVLKTPAACRDIDLHSSLAKMLDDFIGERKRWIPHPDGERHHVVPGELLPGWPGVGT